MSETYISLYGDKADAFDAAKEQMGPDGADLSNAQAVMRLLEAWQDQEGSGRRGGLSR